MNRFSVFFMSHRYLRLFFSFSATCELQMIASVTLCIVEREDEDVIVEWI